MRFAAAYPGWIAGVDGVYVRPSWYPGVYHRANGQRKGWTDYQAACFTRVNDLNAQYVPVTISPVAPPRTLRLEFTAPYTRAALVYLRSVTGISTAEPNIVFFFLAMEATSRHHRWGAIPSSAAGEIVLGLHHTSTTGQFTVNDGSVHPGDPVR
jgi:hypothetical protein